MPYASAADLPTDVRSKLTPAQQERFRGAFNVAIEQGKRNDEAMDAAWREALDDGRRTDSGTGFSRGGRAFRRG